MLSISLPKRIYRRILRLLPMKLALYVIFFRGYYRILNLKKPRFFGERIQWLKLYGHLDELSVFVDKYDVRSFVLSTIGEKYLNKLYGVYDSVEEIDYANLPNKFVLKSTNGSGTVIICQDKDKFDIEKANKLMRKWLMDDYWREKKELQYKNIKNRIIVEKYLENTTGSLNDYKFYCFNGKVHYYCIFYDRYIDKKIDVYDNKGNKLDYVTMCNIKSSDNVEPFDDDIKEMIYLSEKLSSSFSFVRVDFYCVDGNIYFGEMTFTDGAGSDSWHPLEFDLSIGSLIELKRVLNEDVNYTRRSDK